jgi:hypothetical protein
MQIRALDKPFRPLPIKLMNAAGRFLNQLHIEPVTLEKEALIAKAVKRAGCNDFGDMSFHEGLDRLLASFENEANLNMLGRLIAQGTMVERLYSRLKLVEWRKQHPAVAEQEIRKPLFILGLPRTGTTILHALLDVDPANRSPLFWEVEYPVPPATPDNWLTDPRIAKVDKSLEQFLQLCPGITAVHAMEARLPQECVAILAMDMMAEQYHCMFDVPGYAGWLIEQPKTYSLKFHRQFLQHLQSGGVTGERWLLKSPCHLHLIPQLLEAYPDANIIQTHRDPIAVCTSMSSLTAMLRGVGSDAIDLKAIGKQQLDWWGNMLGRSLEHRKQLEHRSGQFFDLKMSETVADPLGAVERIYDFFGYELPPSVKTDMEAFMKNNPRDKHGSHTYKAEDFGIAPEKDRARFADYCAYFGIDKQLLPASA